MVGERQMRPKASRDVRVRLVMAPIVLGVVLGTMALAECFQSRLPLHLLIIFFAIGSGIEFVRMLEPKEPRRRLKGGTLSWIACGVLAGVGLSEFLRSSTNYAEGAALRMELRIVIVIAFTWVILVGKYFLDTRNTSTSEIGRIFLPVLYIGVPLSLACELCVEPLRHDVSCGSCWWPRPATSGDGFLGNYWGSTRWCPRCLPASPGKVPPAGSP